LGFWGGGEDRTVKKKIDQGDHDQLLRVWSPSERKKRKKGGNV